MHHRVLARRPQGWRHNRDDCVASTLTLEVEFSLPDPADPPDTFGHAFGGSGTSTTVACSPGPVDAWPWAAPPYSSRLHASRTWN